MTATRVIDDHIELANIGTKTHAEIEGHIQGIGNYAFPAADGTVNQILETDGAGVLSFVNKPTGFACGSLNACNLSDIGTRAHSSLTNIGASDHHIKYTNADAVTAMGVKGDANPLHHDKYTDAEAAAKIATDDNYVKNVGDLCTGKLTISNSGIEDATGVGYFHLLENAAATRFSAITYSNTFWHAPFFYFLRARGTNSTPLYPQSGDQLWGIFTKGWSESANGWMPTSLIVGIASSNWSAGNYPSDIVFITYVGGAQYKRLTIKYDGKVGIGTDTPSSLLDINSNIMRLRTPKTPATSGASGSQGEMCWDTNYVYICTATNTWKRCAIATW